MNIKLTAAQKIKILNSDDLYAVMQKILTREHKIDRKKEHSWLICLDEDNRILMIELIGLGSLKISLIEPTDVFSFALQKHATKLILVHNDPKGKNEPSLDQIAVTEKMLAIGAFIKLPIIDHMIISEESYYSFADTGLLKRIEEEKRYDLSFFQVDKLYDKIQNLSLETAKKLLKKGMSVEDVAEVTGLTMKQIKGL